MIRRVLKNSNKTNTFLRRVAQYGSSVQEKWDIQAAICLERRPIVTPSLTDLESQFKKVLSEIESERSLKSDFEIRHINEVKQLEVLQKGGDMDETETSVKQTAQDLLDMWTEELSHFHPAQKVTEADQTNQLNTLSRKLDTNLILVLNQKKLNRKFHSLLLDFWKEGETLRQSAERVLKNHCGDSLVAQIYGNAPCGFYKYKYPTEVSKQKGVKGVKVFIYFAKYLKGNIAEEGSDYKWLDRNELKEMLHPECHKAVSQFLIPID